MLKNFWNDIILLNLRDFENIGFDFYINIFLFFVALIIIVYAFFFEYLKGVMQLTVRKLLRQGAIGRDNAKSLSELGLNSNFFVKLILSGGSRFKKTVARIGEPDVSYDDFVKMDKRERKKLYAIDFKTEKFYIAPESKDSADKIFSTYAFSPLRFIMFAVLVILVFGAVAAFSFEILSYINSSVVTK